MSCPVCAGNDANMPCAYPVERPAGCLRVARACPFGDPLCPCQDGDACHYRDLPGSPAMQRTIMRHKDGCMEHRLLHDGRCAKCGAAPESLAEEEFRRLFPRGAPEAA